MSLENISQEEIELRYCTLKQEADAAGYFLNPELHFAKAICRGLLVNQERYGYEVCPCRLASGNTAQDADICCPCDYRDADLAEYGSCY
jgi:ferredoxin-thioredoxin reductase catalytic chain